MQLALLALQKRSHRCIHLSVAPRPPRLPLGVLFMPSRLPRLTSRKYQPCLVNAFLSGQALGFQVARSHLSWKHCSTHPGPHMPRASLSYLNPQNSLANKEGIIGPLMV